MIHSGTEAKIAPGLGGQAIALAVETVDCLVALLLGEPIVMRMMITIAVAVGVKYRQLHAAALAANQIHRRSIKKARAAFGVLITTIDARAKYTNDENLYGRALLRPPATPGPHPTPTAQSNAELALCKCGPIDVRFKGKGEGVLNDIQRQVVGVDRKEGHGKPWLTARASGGPMNAHRRACKKCAIAPARCGRAARSSSGLRA